MRSAPLPPTWTTVEPATTTTTAITTEAGKTSPTQSSARGGFNAPTIALAPSSSSSPSSAAAAAAAAFFVPIEYVNRITGERTGRHPGTSYFLGVVESERNRQKGCGGALPPHGTNCSVGSLDNQHHQSTGSLQQSTLQSERDMHEHTRSIISSVTSKSMNDIMEGDTDWDIHSTRSGGTNSPCPFPWIYRI